MLLTRLALRNPIVVTLFFVLITLVGLLAFARMGRSVLPPISFPYVTVSAVYPGAGPEEIERLVVEPLEDQLQSLPDLDRLSAYAQDGVAVLAVRFRFGSSLQTDRSNVQQALDAARPNMPLDLVAPVVADDDPSQAPVLEEALSSAVLSPRELAALVDRTIAPGLRATAGVGIVAIEGEARRQFTVVPQAAALDALRIAPLDVYRALLGANDVLPGGRLRSAYAESAVAVRSVAESARDLRALPVVGAGGTVRVGDVARVGDDYADPSTMVRVDSKPAVVLFVSRAENADALGAIAAAQRALHRFAAQYPLVRFQTLRTDRPSTQAAIAGVLATLGEGVVLTVLVMLVFLHLWRHAAIAAISIPTSLCAAFAAMWIAGFTINVLSLMGLSLTIGILVDDSIVILEAIARCAKHGISGDEAAIAGRDELGGAAFAITLVDVAVFAPIAFMSGIVGEFMREFGLVVVFATACSLLVSFTLTPLLAARWALVRDREVRRRTTLPWMLRHRFALAAVERWRVGLRAFASFESRVGIAYARVALPAAMQRRGAVFAVAGALTLVSLVPAFAGAIGSEFSPPVARGSATVDLRFASGTPLARSDAESDRVAQRLLGDPAIAHVVVTAGRAFNGSSDVLATELAQIEIVAANPTASTDAFVDEVKSLQALVPDARIAGSGRGMGGTAPIRYTFAGDRIAVSQAAARVVSELERDPGATDVRVSDAGYTPRLEIDVDPQKAIALDVSADDAAQTARLATGGATAAKLRLPGGLTDVVVRSDATEHGDLDAVLATPVRDRTGRLVPIGDVASVLRGVQPAIVERENGQRITSVTANSVAGVPIGRVVAPLARKLRKPGFLPAGVRIEPRGDVEEFLDTVGKMFAALGLAIAIVYAILAVLYRSYVVPLAIMTTVPLASAGALGALLIFRQPLNLYSMLGIVMLVGLVAKNGILLVEYAERRLRRGETAERAIQGAAERRFRPIVMTTLAMIAGMLPLALGHTAGAEYRQAMGTVVIGGLTSSLLLTLFVVPLAYVRLRGRKSQDHRERSAHRDASAPATSTAYMVP